MELVEGRSLEDLRREGPMPTARAVELAVQILAGLQAAHERGIVHRDLSPANVRVSSIPGSDGQLHDFARILDLGFGEGRGTPGYMAPEQYGRGEDADARADLYAVSAILYQLLSGRLPFEADDLASLASRVQSEPAPSLGGVAPHVSPLLAEVVDRGLARDRDARWSNAEAFARALRTAGRLPRATALASTLPSQGMLETQPSPPPRFSRPLATPGTTMRTRRMRRLLRIAVVLGIAAGFGSGAAFALVLLRSRAPAPPAPAPEPLAPARLQPEPPAPPPTGSASAEPPLPSPAPPSLQPSSAPPPPAAKGARAAPRRTRIDSIRQVGTLEVAALDVLADRALPSIVSRCAVSDRSATVEVHLHVHPPGKITLARQAPDDHGDRDVAQCVANRFVAAVPPDWNPGQGASGIVVVKVTVVAPTRGAARR